MCVMNRKLGVGSFNNVIILDPTYRSHDRHIRVANFAIKILNVHYLAPD